VSFNALLACNRQIEHILLLLGQAHQRLPIKARYDDSAPAQANLKQDKLRTSLNLHAEHSSKSRHDQTFATTTTPQYCVNVSQPSVRFAERG
jgi:hypothetical protein